MKFRYLFRRDTTGVAINTKFLCYSDLIKIANERIKLTINKYFTISQTHKICLNDMKNLVIARRHIYIS